ncbi:MAG: toxin-antitoxin system YwqK family antitoxin [Ignavibacteriaceae bacterium]
MRKYLKMFAATLFAASLLVISGCSKKGNPIQPPANPPALPSVTFKGPNTNSTDQYAQLTENYVLNFKEFSSYMTAFANMSAAQNGNTWTWTYKFGALTETMTTTQNSDGSYSWKVVFNGKASSNDTIYYTNWTLLQGTTSTDGKNGSWTIYYENTTIMLAEYNWNTSSGGVLTGTLKTYDNGGNVQSSINVVNNSDGSGSVEDYTGTVLIFKSVWQANGSGQWWTYDSSTGGQVGTGSWT